MLIKSQFRDYYDHVAHVYGGGDPSVLYLRNRIVEDNVDNYEGSLKLSEVKFPINTLLTNHHDIDYDIDMIVVGEYYFYVLSKGTQSKLFTRNANEKLYETYFLKKSFRRRIGLDIDLDVNQERIKFDDFILLKNPKIIQISKLVKQPVYKITSIDNYAKCVTIAGRIPNLGELGVAKYLPAEKVYQDLSYVVGNLLKESPDLAPPIQVSDKDRLSQHGFDHRISFRHRKD